MEQSQVTNPIMPYPEKGGVVEELERFFTSVTWGDKPERRIEEEQFLL